MRRFILGANILIAAIGLTVPNTIAQNLDQKTIIDKLTSPGPATRSLSRSLGGQKKHEISRDNKNFLNSLSTRGIKFNVETKDKVYDLIEDHGLPKLDFEINFEFGSAEINHESFAQLIEFSRALSHTSLQHAKILLIGHTDAKGSREFNHDLSERRANSVVNFLVQAGNISPSRLVAFGYGEDRLKNTHDPHADENRRVEVINITQQ